ncbi:MAG TPA: hypothetical protein VFZ32_11930 [Micromonosporaceae bacterium]
MSTVRDFLNQVAEQLGDRASLRVESLDGDEWIELLPRNPRAAKVAVGYSPLDPDADLWITIADEDGGEPGDLEWLEQVSAAAIAGRVRLIEGSGRHLLEVTVASGDVRGSTAYDLRGCLPAPFWPRRATVTQFEPYS